MRFLFVGSVVCRRLPSAHASRRWPCHWLCAWRYLLHSGLAPIRTRPCRAHKDIAKATGALLADAKEDFLKDHPEYIGDEALKAICNVGNAGYLVIRKLAFQNEENA